MTKYKADKNKQLLYSIYSDSHAVLSSFGNDIYMSDLVNNAICCVANEFSKVGILSVVDFGDKIAPQNDDIARLFRSKPNPLQTTKDFLASLIWLRLKKCNCFIYPQWVEVMDSKGQVHRIHKAFYPLNPQGIEMGPITEGGGWYIKFTWRDGSTDTLPYDDVIHLRWRRGVNLVIGGGDDFAMPDERDTLRALTAFDEIVQGIPKGIKSALQLNGILVQKTAIDSSLLENARADFESHIQKSESGIVALDLSGEFIPIKNAVPVVPPATLDMLKRLIHERYGVSEAILSGDYTGEQHNAFYETCIEDLIVEFEQAFSYACFTPRELDVGHRVKCYYNQLNHLSTQGKIDLATIGYTTGVLTLNQIAGMFGLPPFEGGDKRLQSLNFVDQGIINQYQLLMKGIQEGDANGTTGKQK